VWTPGRRGHAARAHSLVHHHQRAGRAGQAFAAADPIAPRWRYGPGGPESARDRPVWKADRRNARAFTSGDREDKWPVFGAPWTGSGPRPCGAVRTPARTARRYAGPSRRPAPCRTWPGRPRSGTGSRHAVETSTLAGGIRKTLSAIRSILPSQP